MEHERWVGIIKVDLDMNVLYLGVVEHYSPHKAFYSCCCSDSVRENDLLHASHAPHGVEKGVWQKSVPALLLKDGCLSNHCIWSYCLVWLWLLIFCLDISLYLTSAFLTNLRRPHYGLGWQVEKLMEPLDIAKVQNPIIGLLFIPRSL